MIYRYREGMGANPATVDITNGIVYINRAVWNSLTDYEKAIVLLHEEGHYANNSVDEIKADIYAIDKYLSEADTPERRRELLDTIFHLVPDDERKVVFVRNLLNYDEACGNTSARLLLSTLDEYEPKTANALGAVLAITDVVLRLVNIGIGFWQQEDTKGQYWSGKSPAEKERIINDAARAAIWDAFLSSGGSYSATMIAAEKPASDPESIWYAMFVIIAQGVPMQVKEFGGKTQMTASEASAIFWSKQGYSQSWTANKVTEYRQALDAAWDGLSFVEKVRYSTTYKVYVLVFIMLCIVVWKM